MVAGGVIGDIQAAETIRTNGLQRRHRTGVPAVASPIQGVGTDHVKGASSKSCATSQCTARDQQASNDLCHQEPQGQGFVADE
jgi:hypothetical protein